jgi:hypothetical protein
VAGAAEPRRMTVRIGYALAMAAATGALVQVAGPLMDQLAVPAQGDLVGQFVGDLPLPRPRRGLSRLVRRRKRVRRPAHRRPPHRSQQARPNFGQADRPWPATRQSLRQCGLTALNMLWHRTHLITGSHASNTNWTFEEVSQSPGQVCTAMVAVR